METFRGERFGDHPEANRSSHSGNFCSWFPDGHRPNFTDNYQQRRRYNQFDQMNGDPGNFFGGQSTPFSGRKRGFPHSGIFLLFYPLGMKFSSWYIKQLYTQSLTFE